MPKLALISCQRCPPKTLAISLPTSVRNGTSPIAPESVTRLSFCKLLRAVDRSNSNSDCQVSVEVNRRSAYHYHTRLHAHAHALAFHSRGNNTKSMNHRNIGAPQKILYYINPLSESFERRTLSSPTTTTPSLINLNIFNNRNQDVHCTLPPSPSARHND